MADHRFTNRLYHEKSPYLQQHAHNPVDWYPWGDEAFEQARRENKPIFLSIGYATCHWCHVMERESFEDEEIAAKMNEVFINVKVDREELPEVDALYMEFAQSMMSGAAGWPLNLVLTSDLQPFFAATYLPPNSSQGLMGMRNLAERITEVWGGEERERVMEQASKIVEVFAESIHLQGSQLPARDLLGKLGELFFKMADPVYGGMKGSPKFPIGYQANFLLAHCRYSRDPRALFLVERTLTMMQRGGIYDHLGGGFSRYSVDEKWLVPHFEKMLYDNALLGHAYVQLWQVSHQETYQTVASEILDYVLREMTHAEGGFFSAEDADSEGQEGLFYTWTFKEVHNILGPEQADLFCQFYGMTEEGNFEGRNILNIKHDLHEFSAAQNLDPKALEQLLEKQRKNLWQARCRRPHPLKDDKILSSWNGMMIHTLVDAGASFENTTYLDAAQRAARFIKMHLWDSGTLQRRWRDGHANYSGGLDEYAFLIRACISLFEADQGVQWLQWAKEMTAILEQTFKVESGAFYQTNGTDKHLILRKVQYSDGAEPSGNAIHCENLLRLYQLSQDRSYLEQAEDILRAVKRYIDSYSPGYTYHLLNVHRYYDERAPLFVVALNREGEWRDELRALLYRRYQPFKGVIFRRPGDEELIQTLPYVEPHVAIDGKTTLYICYHGVCQEPLNDFDEMVASINAC